MKTLNILLILLVTLSCRKDDFIQGSDYQRCIGTWKKETISFYGEIEFYKNGKIRIDYASMSSGKSKIYSFKSDNNNWGIPNGWTRFNIGYKYEQYLSFCISPNNDSIYVDLGNTDDNFITQDSVFTCFTRL